MPYLHPHNVLTIIGTAANNNAVDVWQTGVRIGGGGGLAVSTNAAATAILDDVQADLVTWWTAIRGYYAPSTRFERFKFNAVDVNGHYISQDLTLQRDMPAATVPGSASGNPLPAQLAIAATLTTAATRGYASKGRMFLPAPATVQMGTLARVDEPFRNAMQVATATLLTNLSNWPGLDAAGSPGRAIVASKVGAGTERRITGVVVGNRWDVQRRRANRIPEVKPAATAVS